MAEVDSSPGNPKIPENWDFFEKEHNPNVTQIDQRERYIAFKYGDVDPENREYIFGPDGSKIYKRSQSNSLDYVNVTEIQGEGVQNYIFREVLLADNILPALKSKPKVGEKILEVRILESQSFEKFYQVTYKMNAGNDIVFSSRGKPLFAKIGGLFVLRDGLVPAPTMALSLAQGKEGLRKEDWELDPKIFANQPQEDFVAERQEGLNGIDYYNSRGEKKFSNTWDIELREDRMGNETPFLLIAQNYYGRSQKIGKEVLQKILAVPTQINMGQIGERMLSVPPYQRNESDKLVISWTETGRIVGASLSYFYPPPTSQK